MLILLRLAHCCAGASEISIEHSFPGIWSSTWQLCPPASAALAADSLAGTSFVLSIGGDALLDTVTYVGTLQVDPGHQHRPAGLLASSINILPPSMPV
jgi:hypothetical protein